MKQSTEPQSQTAPCGPATECNAGADCQDQKFRKQQTQLFSDMAAIRPASRTLKHRQAWSAQADELARQADTNGCPRWGSIFRAIRG